MKLWLILVAVLIAGLAAGGASAMLIIYRGSSVGQTDTDGWLGNRSVGSTRADPWTRAIVAKMGLLALNRSETIYYTRYVDEAGRPLDAQCTYEMTGTNLPARWWSVTIYGADDYLPMNEDGAFSIDATRTVRSADDTWTAIISSTRAEAANWISTKAAGTFNLSLRLYNPMPDVLAGDAAVPFPTLKRLSCAAEAG